MAVVKILTRHSPSYGSLIKYILDEKKTDEKLIFTHNLRSNDIKGFIKEYQENELFRQRHRSDQVYLTHEIISFHRDENQDKLTPEMLSDMARVYIKLRGEQGMYIGAVHQDTEHIHIHYCISSLEYRTGKSFHVAKPQLHELKVAFQEYHRTKYPGLEKSFCEHGKGKPYLTDRAWQKAHREERNRLKEEVTSKVTECLEKSRSQTEFLTLLRNIDLHHYERKGRVEGVMTQDGTKFRFSRLGFSESIAGLPIQNEQIPKKMNTKNMNDDRMGEAQAIYLEWQLKRNEDLLESVIERQNAIFMELQFTETGKASPEQRAELDELSNYERVLLEERESIELAQENLRVEEMYNDRDEFDDIREEQNHSDLEMSREDEQRNAGYDEFDEIREEHEDDREMEERDL